MTWTPEMRQKAQKTRRLKRERKAAKLLPEVQPRARAKEIGKSSSETPNLRVPSSSVSPSEFLLPTTEDWMELSTAEAEALVQKLLACYQEGARVINQKNYERSRQQTYCCLGCQRVKPMITENGRPNYVWRDDRKDPQTGIYSSRFICSQQCWMRGQSEGKLTSKALSTAGHAFKQEDSRKEKTV